MIVTQIVFELQALTPVSVAAPERASTKSEVDLPISADAWGNPYLPAASVAGSLRAHAKGELGSAEVLFGADLALVEGGDQQHLPSAVRFLGTTVTLPGDPQVSHQTAVSRWGGAAADKSLRSREALPAKTSVAIYLCAEDLPTAALEQLRGVLKTWRPLLGGATGSGLGRMRVSMARHRTLDLGKRADLAVWLASDGPAGFGTGTGPAWNDWKLKPAPDPDHVLRLQFKIASDLRIGAHTPSAQKEADSLQVDGQYVIPGSSWRGVFRSRAEYILRSAGIEVCASTDERPCGHCPTCELFGWSGPRGGGGARGRVRFQTSVISGVQTARRTHVAIDRFTGGARAGQLFNETVLTSGTAELVVSLSAEVRVWAEPLMAWVAMDIHDGFVGVGHGTSRGMGSLQLVEPAPVRAMARDITAALAHRQPTKHPEA